MKKLIYILTLATLLCSCSAEKRLAHLLERHPELHKDTVYVIDTCFIYEADTNSVRFTIDDLIALLKQLQNQTLPDSVALGTEDHDPLEANNSTPQDQTNSISAENKGSLASITPNADGSFNLNAITKPDTIFINKKVPVPVYFTETKEKIMYKMTQAQTFFFGLGILFLVIIAITFALKIAKFFKK